MLHLSITLCLCYFLTVTVTVAELENQLSLANFFSNQYINEINSIQQFWKAGRNFDPDTTLEDVRNLLGELDSEVPEKSKIKNSDHEWPSVDEIPETFDARTHWRKECPRISEVLDQGHCGSCWAVSSSSAATDRHCIKSKGKLQIRLSANHITACCHHCGHACFGGKTRLAWDFYQTHGLITGGSYNSSEGCQPYSIESCEHGGSGSTSSTLPSCSSLPKEDPVCSTKCTNKGYRIPFKRDRHKNKDSYVIMGAETIQKDILAHGPMVVSFKTYSDFPHYKSGVYVKTSRASRIGNHAVKVIGWGKDKINGRDLPYWLIMNSWNEQWGDKGLFKILRGSNHCGVEERATGGVPRHYYKT